MVGNPITDPKFDENYKIPSAHGFGIISDQIYEVIPNSFTLTKSAAIIVVVVVVVVYRSKEFVAYFPFLPGRLQ